MLNRPCPHRLAPLRLVPFVLAALAALAPAPRADAAPPFEGRLSGDNLLEARAGNFPFVTPRDRTDTYDQLNLGYDATRLRVGLRAELEQNSQDELTYARVTQRWAAWRDDRVDLRLGHFYTLLGRGLIHRSFELPGVVLDYDQARQRSRHTPSRDLDGARLEATLGRLDALAFTGRPNAQYTPGSHPAAYPRTEGQLSGGQVAARPGRGARLGAAWARFDAGGRRDEFGSGFLELDPARLAGLDAAALPVYVEYATRGATAGEWLRFSTGDARPHALYAGANLVVGGVALSAEWKDYAGFRNGVNDPPSLVREQSWALLNRNTHVLNAQREEGYQLEATWAPAAWAAFTLNRAGAEGLAGHFQESYLEWHAGSAEPGAWETTLAYDAGGDGVLLPYQHTWCLAATRALPAELTLTVGLERMSGRNSVNAFRDHALSATLARAERGSLAVTWERSTDALQADPERPGRPRHFVAAQLGARLSAAQDALLFVGTRRGGRACTAGTCYEVEPFRGAELRLTSRF